LSSTFRFTRVNFYATQRGFLVRFNMLAKKTYGPQNVVCGKEPPAAPQKAEIGPASRIGEIVADLSDIGRLCG